MTVVCYPSHGKKKAMKICTFFARGCGGDVAPVNYPKLVGDHAAFFYGWTEHTGKLIRRCQAEGRPWLYADNAYYFGRGDFFRITWNALMVNGRGPVANGKQRLSGFGINPAPRRDNGQYVLIATQSELFYQLLHGTTRDKWVEATKAEIRKYTDRPIEVCHKPAPPWKGLNPHRNFEEALPEAWAVVSHSSSVMVKAIIDGVPVFPMARSMAAAVGNDSLQTMEDPVFPSEKDRTRWLRMLAANQWTKREMRSGAAWRALNDSKHRFRQ